MQYDCKTTLNQAQGQLLTLEYMLDLDNLQKDYRDTVIPGGIESTPEQVTTLESSSSLYCEISLNLDVQNIIEGLRQRKPYCEAYKVSLVKNSYNLDIYHSAFTAVISDNKPKIDQMKLPLPLKYYREMLRHLHRAEFKVALQKEFNTLEHKGIFKKVDISEAKGELIILTIVVFIYKFNEEGYLL